MSKIEFKNIIIGSFFLLILSPLGIETNSFSIAELNMINAFNLFRIFFPIIIFFILIFFFFRKNVYFKTYSTQFFLIYFITLLISTLLNVAEVEDLTKLLLPFYSIVYFFLALYLLNDQKLSVNFEKYIFLQFLIITLISTYSLFNFTYYFITQNLPDLYFQKIENNFYNQNSSGLSRILLVISLFIFIINKRNKFFYLSLILINLFIFLLQSKFTILFLITFLIFKLIIEKEILKKKIINFFIILILPLFLTMGITYVKSDSNNLGKIRIVSQLTSDIKNNETKTFDSYINRYKSWELIVKNSEKNLFGNGSQADRKLTIDQPKHSQLASNAIIYGYASSGLIGMSFLILFYFQIFKLLISKKIYLILKNNNKLAFFYLAMIVFILFRSLIENSFALWSVDFLLLINCYLALQKKL